MSDEPQLDASLRRRAGHYEVLGETYAKFEFFEQGWNPYSRFLDVDKVDLILRRTVQGRRLYREVQVKFGKLYHITGGWQLPMFDVTSWRFFKSGEFDAFIDSPDFYIAYVLSADTGYQGDIFIFPVRDFASLLSSAIASKGKRKVYISRSREDPRRWYLRRVSKFDAIKPTTCCRGHQVPT